MALTASWRGGRRRSSYLKVGVLAALIIAGLTSFAPSSWAVDGGYGPSGGYGSGGSGTLGNIVMAKTIGSDGGSIFGSYRLTKITIVIPGGALPSDEVVEAVTSVPDCVSLKGQDLVIGLAISALDGKNRQDDFAAGSSATLSSLKITPNSKVFYVDDEHHCILAHLPINDGQVTVPLDATSAFVITSPHKSGSDHHAHHGFFRDHDWFGHEYQWLLDEWR